MPSFHLWSGSVFKKKLIIRKSFYNESLVKLYGHVVKLYDQHIVLLSKHRKISQSTNRTILYLHSNIKSPGRLLKPFFDFLGARLKEGAFNRTITVFDFIPIQF